MYLKDKLLGNRIISVSNGKIIGTVKQIYLDEDRRGIEKIDFGKNRFVGHKDIVFLGEDIVLISWKKRATPQTKSKIEKIKTDQTHVDAEQSSMIQAASKNINKEVSGINWWVLIDHNTP